MLLGHDGIDDGCSVVVVVEVVEVVVKITERAG